MKWFAAAAVVLSVSAADAAPAEWEKSPIKDWAKVPAAAKEPKFRPPAAKRFTLANGIKVVVVEQHKLPLVSLVLVVPGAGYADDPAGQGGLAGFTADLLDEGADTMSALDISEEQDRLGAEVSFFAAADAAYGEASALKKTLDSTIGLFTKILTLPSFADKEVARVHNDRLTALKLRRDRPREIAGLVLAGALYGPETPYGHPGSGHIATFEKLGAADARGFWESRWNPAAMTLVVAGDVTPAELKPKLAALGAWRPAKLTPAAKLVVTEATPPARLLLVDRPGAEQSDIRIGLVGLDRADKRYAKFEVMKTILGDGFTSRLVQRLREQLGYTYGISASMGYRKQRGMFMVSTAIVTPMTGAGIGEIDTIIKDLAEKPVGKDELEKSKQSIVRAFPQQFETTSGTADAYADLALYGLPDSWFTKILAEIRKVTAKDVQAMTKTIVPMDRLVYVVVGDMKTIRPELDKLTLGAPKAYSLDGLPTP